MTKSSRVLELLAFVSMSFYPVFKEQSHHFYLQNDWWSLAGSNR
ncbi:hypothetical protein [Planococcus kocurii]|nr:hypothetical protein [Planococcus kocurii]